MNPILEDCAKEGINEIDLAIAAVCVLENWEKKKKGEPNGSPFATSAR